MSDTMTNVYDSSERSTMLETVTRWIREGSELEDIFESSNLLEVTLRGKDGCVERFTCDYTR